MLTATSKDSGTFCLGDGTGSYTFCLFVKGYDADERKIAGSLPSR
jgi:hypothetical protein